MAYTPDPTDPTSPTVTQLAGNMAYELQALKGYIQTLISSGSNFNYAGGMRNRLINGDFKVTTRASSGTVPANITNYIADRWLLATIAGATDWAVGGGVSGAYYIRLIPQAGMTTAGLSQRIESINCKDLFAGTPVTVSGYFMVDDTSVQQPNIYITTANATDNFAAQTDIVVGASLGIANYQANTWMFFKKTFTLTGDGFKGISLFFNMYSSAVGKQLFFTQLQLEVGSLATPFEFRHQALELSLVSRYYQNMHVVMLNTAVAAGNVFTVAGQFTPQMRVTPSFSYTDVSLINCTHDSTGTFTNGWRTTLNAAGAGNIVGNFTLSFDAEL